MAKSWVPDAQFQTINRGGDGWVSRPKFSPDSGGQRINGANAYLQRSNGDLVGLWVNEITSDFELAGEFGQSKRKRTFFPHNFVQPSLTISGQTPNSYEYNRLAMFIRQNQLDAMRLESGGTDDFLNFIVPARGSKVTRNTKGLPYGTVRGDHDAINVEGYVQLVKAGAEQFVNAPDYSFQFIILKANDFLGLQDNVVALTKLKSITQIFKDKSFGFEFETAPKPFTPSPQQNETNTDLPTPTVPGVRPQPGQGDPAGGPK